MRKSWYTDRVAEFRESQALLPRRICRPGFLPSFRHYGDGDDDPSIASLRQEPPDWNQVATDIAATRV